MDKLLITGPCELNGEVSISRAKNSSLPLMTATLLTGEEVALEDLPNLRDIETLSSVLEMLGQKISFRGNKTVFNAQKLNSFEATYDVVRKMRASILVLGPLLARFGKAKVSLPGGCAIGTRPIDIHLEGLKQMGADIELHSGYVYAHTKRLQGANIEMRFPSVGATENLMMAASLAQGTTIITNAAKEPEIEDLADLINKMGGKVQGAGTDRIEIEGVDELHGCEHRPIADRIEAATYLLAGLMTKSEITVSDCNPTHIQAVIDLLKNSEAQIEVGDNYIKTFKSENIKGIRVQTGPFPEFPTDVQAQLMSYLLTVDDYSQIEETIFENRYMHVSELQRLGADIKLDGNTATIKGGKKLIAAPVMCTDLRASAALVLTSLVSYGTTEILRIYHLERGYENLDQKFKMLGADVKKVPT